MLAMYTMQQKKITKIEAHDNLFTLKVWKINEKESLGDNNEAIKVRGIQPTIVIVAIKNVSLEQHIPLNNEMMLNHCRDKSDIKYNIFI